MNIKIISIISIILLLIGIPTGWAYGYYIFLRWAIFISSVIITYKFYEQKRITWVFIFAVLAILFNPIAPIYLEKSTWILIDFISSVLFYIVGFTKFIK